MMQFFMESVEKLRELDAWIARHLFGDEPDPSKTIPFSSEQYCHPHYTTEPAASMQVLERCIKHSKKSICCCISVLGYQVYLGGADYAKSVQEASTLPLAISRFAKKLFEK